MRANLGLWRRSQSGFTLIELLVVLLILGLLAAFAIPAFFNQRDKASDAEAKTQVRTAETAIATYAAEKNGNYAGATADTLQAIEPALADVNDADFTVQTGVAGLRYRLAVVSTTGNEFWIRRRTDGSLFYPCTTADSGGCPVNGSWGD